MTRLQTLTDNFPGPTLSDHWTPEGTVSVISNEAVVTVASDVNGIHSTFTYSLAGSFIRAKIDVDKSAVVTFKVTDQTTSDYMALVYKNSTLQAVLQHVNGAGSSQVASTGYDAAVHTYWQLRENNGIGFWETSPDSKTWAQLLSYPLMGMRANLVRFTFEAISTYMSVGGYGTGLYGIGFYGIGSG